MWRSMKGLLTLAGSGLGLALGFIDCSNEQNYLQEAVLKARADYSSPEWFRWRQYEVFHWPVGCDR